MSRAASLSSIAPTRQTERASDLARRALEHLASAAATAVGVASPRTLELILSARDPREALALAQRDLLPTPPAREAAIRRAQLAGVKMRQDLLGRLSGTATRAQAAELLDLKPTALDRRRERGRVLALQVGREHVYPLDQFDGGAVIAGIPEILSAMRGATGWAVLDFLTTPLAEFGDRTPLAVLASAKGDGATIEQLRRRAATERPSSHGG